MDLKLGTALTGRLFLSCQPGPVMTGPVLVRQKEPRLREAELFLVPQAIRYQNKY
jgi:hypothetical protein